MFVVHIILADNLSADEETAICGKELRWAGHAVADDNWNTISAYVGRVAARGWCTRCVEHPIIALAMLKDTAL